MAMRHADPVDPATLRPTNKQTTPMRGRERPPRRRHAMPSIQTITPCLWFDDQAEEAAAFYTGIFPNSRIVSVTRYSEAGHEIHGRAAGSVMTVTFILD